MTTNMMFYVNVESWVMSLSGCEKFYVNVGVGDEDGILLFVWILDAFTYNEVGWTTLVCYSFLRMIRPFGIA